MPLLWRRSCGGRWRRTRFGLGGRCADGVHAAGSDSAPAETSQRWPHGRVVADVGNILPAVAFGIGLTFGFSFDTAGPRREVVADERVREERVRDADAPLTADREPYPTPVTTTDTSRDADTDADADGYPDRTAVTTTSREREDDRGSFPDTRDHAGAAL